jgi:DNA-binding NtrC family response regulator
MADEETALVTTSDGDRSQPSVAPATATPVDRWHLLVFHAGSSSLFPLPPDGEVLIGRGEDAQLRIAHTSISRAHARIVLAGERATLTDLGSHNGTRVNGIRLARAHDLKPGDVISLGAATLVLQHDAQGAPRRSIVERSQLQERLAEEVARAIRFSRPVTLISIDLGQPLPPLKLAEIVLPGLELINVVGMGGPNELLVVLPEVAVDAAQPVAARLVALLAELAPEARAGLASCPAHAADADALIGVARNTANHARPGHTLAADETVTVRRIGEHRVVIADPAMIHLYDLIARVAESDLPVLILGETGVGKEIAAAAIHQGSRRRDKPLVAINCAAIQELLVESELFGYERGAFSGATAAKPGRLESAHGGTVLLDEVGELSATAQAKLLRAVETRRISRLGAVTERELDIRLLCATNRNLEEEIARGRFRQDLFFRISAATVTLPPLHERPGEIALLAADFLQHFCDELARPLKTLSPEAREALVAYRWPGNVRELKHLMHYLASVVTDRVIEPHHILPRLRGERARTSPLPSAAPSPAGDAAPQFRRVEDEVRELEKDRMERALAAAEGNQRRAAELIGMPLRTFTAKMSRYQIVPSRRRPR